MSEAEHERRITELESELHSLRDEFGEMQTDLAGVKTDVLALKSEIAQVRVDIERVSRRVLESTLESRRADKVVFGKLDDMRATIGVILELVQPRAAALSPPTPPFGKDS